MYPTQRVIVAIALIFSVASALSTGVALSRPQASPETAAPKPGSIEGVWLGAIQLPATKLRIVFNITPKPDGSFSATLDSLDQGATGIPVSAVGVEKNKVTLDVSVVSGRYEGTLNEDGSAISGKWTQGGVSLDLALQRVNEAPKPVRPQEPKKPYPYSEEEVAYENTKAGVTFAGTLTMPRTGGPFPAVLLITGSGDQDRDETVCGHRPFLILADCLTRRGVAVLRVDDRGVGGSTGSTSQATSRDFARDVLAGVQYLKTRDEIDPNRIGLIGHSDGGVIAPMAAVDSNDVAFIVLMAAPGVTGEQILKEQLVDLLKAAGASQAVIDVAAQKQERILEVVKNEADPNAANARLRAIIAEDSPSLSEQQVDAQVQQATSPWFRFFVTYDPRETLRKVRCPVLAINGSLDLQVSARTNLPAIEQALREGGNPDFAVQELPGLNHLFQTAATGTTAEYARIDETMSPLALETIAKWIEAQTR